jgi:glycyl-tRNA synthetase
MDCKNCKSRWRADKLVEELLEKNPEIKEPEGFAGDKTETKRLEEIVKELNIECPECGACNFTEIKKFNLMLKTFL